MSTRKVEDGVRRKNQIPRKVGRPLELARVQIKLLEKALEKLRAHACSCDFQEEDKDCAACSISRTALSKETP